MYKFQSLANLCKDLYGDLRVCNSKVIGCFLARYPEFFLFLGK